MESELLKSHSSLQRAIDVAMWTNFKYRLSERSYGVILDKKTKLYEVVQTNGRRKSTLTQMPLDYSTMSYEQIQTLRTIVNPLSHWQEITGLFSSTHGEILRFIIANKIPLEKLIRYELAIRGYDQNHIWVGYDKAGKIWLK